MMTANTSEATILQQQQPHSKHAPVFGLLPGLAQLLAASQKQPTSKKKKFFFHNSRYGG